MRYGTGSGSDLALAEAIRFASTRPLLLLYRTNLGGNQ